MRVPWSLGLLGVLAAVSFLFGGDRSGADVVVEPPRAEALLEDPSDVATEAAVERALADVMEAESSAAAAEEAQRVAQQEAERLRLETLLAQEDSALRAEIAELARLRQEAESTRAAAERATAGRVSEPASRSATAPAPAAQPQANGVLRLIVLPFADVYVQGTLRAQATSRFELPLAPGTYSLRLVNPTRAALDTTFAIDSGEATDVRATLPPRDS